MNTKLINDTIELDTAILPIVENILLVNRYAGNLPLNTHKDVLKTLCRQSGGLLSFDNARHFKAILDRLNRSVNFC